MRSERKVANFEPVENEVLFGIFKILETSITKELEKFLNRNYFTQQCLNCKGFHET